MNELPLKGIRVVEVTALFAGPYASMILADWGAEVIRVETLKTMAASPRGTYAHLTRETVEEARKNGQGSNFAYPDWDPGPRPWNRAVSFTTTGRNKKSMTVDLTTSEGHEVLGRLVATADIFIENNVPETMEKLKISYEWLQEWKPDIIMLRMPAYGLSGPYKNYRATGGHVDSVTGHTYIMGHPGEPLDRRGSTVAADAASGASAAFSALAALWHRERTDRGQMIELTLAENLIPLLAESVLDYTMNGRVRETIGNRDYRMAPHGVYPCKGDDAWLTLSVGTDDEWRGLCAAMGDTELALDPRFADSLSRWQNQDALDEVLSAWTRDQDHYDLFHLLQRHGVPAGPVLSEPEVLEDPHLAAREFYQRMEHPEMPVIKYNRPLFRMSGVPYGLRTPPPLMGQHNEYVYKDILGVSEEEYRRLEGMGHIGMDMDPSVP